MGIIDRYIAREILFSWLTALLVLLVIVLSTEAVHLLQWVAQGRIPVNAFFAFLVNSLFEFSVVTIPLSLLLGVLLGFGRLYKDSEMAAIMASGVAPLQLYRPLMAVVIPVILLLLVLTLFVKPMVAHQRANLKAEIKSQTQVDSLLVGQFNRASKGGAVLFLESKDKVKKQNDNAFFQQNKGDKTQVDIAASTRTITDEKGHRYMVMAKGVNYEGKAGDAALTIVEYGEYGIHIDKKQVQPHLAANTKTMQQLWQSEDLRDKAQLQWRLSTPIATFIVAFIALPLSRTDPRSGRYSKLALALVLYLLYSNLLGVAETWIIQDKVPVWVGLWWVHLLALALLYVLLKSSGYLVKVPAIPASGERYEVPKFKEDKHGS